MLLHPCECNIRFTSTEGEVLVNHYMSGSVITNIFYIEAIRYTHCACSEAQGVWTKIEDSNHVSEDPINLQNIRLFLAFIEEKAESLWGRGWWFCIERGAATLEDLFIKRHAVHCITSKGRTVHCINRSALYLIYCAGGPFEV